MGFEAHCSTESCIYLVFSLFSCLSFVIKHFQFHHIIQEIIIWLVTLSDTELEIMTVPEMMLKCSMNFDQWFDKFSI